MATNLSEPTEKGNLPITGLEFLGTSERVEPRQIDYAVIQRQFSEHDQAKVSFSLATRNSDLLKNALVRFQWGSNPDNGFFFGSVYQASKPQPFQDKVSVSVDCIGPTRVMQRPATGFYVNASTTQVVNDLIRPHRLGAYVPDHWYRYSRLSLRGMSEWQAVARLTRRLGLRLVTFNGVSWLCDPQVELEAGAAAYTFRKSGNVLDPAERSLLDFKPNASVTQSSDDMIPSFGYFDQANRANVYSPSEAEVRPEDVRWVNDTYIQTSDTAKLVQEQSRKDDLWDQHAVARIRGNAAIFPGMIVNINTGIVSSLEDSYDGLWCVSAATHEMNSSSYQTALVLFRDRFRRMRQGVPYLRFWERDRRLYPSMRDEDATRWVSSWRI